jgi:hypothetical protein
MNRFAFLVASTVLFVSSISTFASAKVVSALNPGISHSAPVNMVIQDQSTMPKNEWVGKTVDQLIEKMGKPDSTYVGAGGDKLYAYDKLIARNGRAPERTLRVEFDIASDGSIKSETSSIF